ncbi:MAG TPA: tetratricopeptide repeat protein [Labilithrix sp.]|nr:tetratricopeptide repeat protein [Labilithrix sp.]
MGRWSHGWVVGLSLTFGALGCASTQPPLKRDLETMQRESTPAQLAQRGEAFAAVGDMTRAEQYFVAALRGGGDAGALARRLIAVCVADGRYPAALEYADEYLRKHPDGADVRFAAATLRRALGDDEGARRELERVIAIRPDLADAQYALAQIERDDGNVMAADARFRAYLKIDPTGAHAEEARANLMSSVP